jgi:hypothetical protein
MDKNDSLMVVDIANKTAKWINIDPTAAKYIQDHWSKYSSGDNPDRTRSNGHDRRERRVHAAVDLVRPPLR